MFIRRTRTRSIDDSYFTFRLVRSERTGSKVENVVQTVGVSDPPGKLCLDAGALPNQTQCAHSTDPNARRTNV